MVSGLCLPHAQKSTYCLCVRRLRRRVRILLLTLLGLSFSFPVLSQEEVPANFRPRTDVHLVTEPPEIDGKLDEAFWSQAQPLRPLVQVIPVQGATPSQPTDIRIVRTKRALYFGVRCYDDHPNEIIARVMEQDVSLRSEDRVVIALDTFLNERSGYVFAVNPRGSRWDGLIEYAWPDPEWDTIWQARATIDHLGWMVEIEIPFESIAFDPKNDAWGMNFKRTIRRTNESLRWSSPDVNRSFLDMAEAGEMAGMLGAEQGLGLDIVPAMSVSRVDDHVENEHEFETKPGGDIFYRPIPSVTTAVTANTDFGETEADLFQANLTRFALFFPEKRAFFLQDANIFEFAGPEHNGRPFYSRRIGLVNDEEVPLLLGGKVTGRVGRVNFGLLETWTGSGEGVGQKSLGVERISLNVGRESSLGVIATHGDPDSDRESGLVGFDGTYRNSEWRNGDKVVEARAWAQRSFNEGQNGLQSAWGGSVSYPNDRINWWLDYKEISSDFEPALGFVNRTDIREYRGWFRYRLRPEWIRTIDFSVYSDLVTDRNNELRTGKIWITPLDFNTPIGDRFAAGYFYDFEKLVVPFEIYPGIVIPTGEYSDHRIAWEIKASRARPLSIIVEGEAGQYYSGRFAQITPSVVFRPSRHLATAIIYDGSFVDLPQGNFQRHIVVARIDLMFTVDLSWNTLVQYEHETGEIGIDSRLRWIVVPGRELYIVLKQELQARDGSVYLNRSVPLIKVRWTFRF